jgi:soluble lytic murein transglycosylase-like protein
LAEALPGSATSVDAASDAVVVEAVPAAPVGLLSPIFSPEVRYWEKEILQWSAEHGLDPNMAATIMQIESCGDLQAVSSAGAQGLFQVMPFHFSDGENTLDPNTNARRGLNYFAEQLQRFGDVNMAFAAYNGGPGNAVKSYENWPHETQRYYYWGQGIYADAQAGATSSSRLQEWMQAGGASLCRQAAARLGLE